MFQHRVREDLLSLNTLHPNNWREKYKWKVRESRKIGYHRRSNYSDEARIQAKMVLLRAAQPLDDCLRTYCQQQHQEYRRSRYVSDENLWSHLLGSTLIDFFLADHCQEIPALSKEKIYQVYQVPSFAFEFFDELNSLFHGERLKTLQIRDLHIRWRRARIQPGWMALIREAGVFGSTESALRSISKDVLRNRALSGHTLWEIISDMTPHSDFVSKDDQAGNHVLCIGENIVKKVFSVAVAVNTELLKREISTPISILDERGHFRSHHSMFQQFEEILRLNSGPR